ncbi:TRAP dicarboxylate transporter substrate-binding protein DctP subunit (plasmid) [Rhizobium gallicum]|uniref:TRAP dicarboxylate transporter substrate-binding protein DctP subunit n=4 Tax=Rhizobium TaxID=379 RepID=A0A0B4X8M1_9HYPH|nr:MULTISPECIES: TRAP transporter substrate-binding protein [Rhizobium]AJD43506.1 TRAP dicarboxylate transporter substrate-binding protein DctP subunit [Rhizobium gallicum bv. gallicum R602sp]APO69998.1 TRAP dicarboxylate transporter substrate-binding protein DctP subunit [Rhizobium gallicum]TCU34749.1 tripartite ATP-independent transporter DctP family solute receptor [Rhizobium azibense]TDW26472.1 tripartite ATP-independent transporter DctP family solute receptor [Rhizobium azibense]
MITMNRRTLIMSSVAMTATLATPRIMHASSPEFSFKFANIMPVDHPLNTRMTEASNKISEQTDGRVSIQVFPASQLGTDADMLSQLRSGGLDLLAQTGLIAATLVPPAAITGVGFAYPDYAQVWKSVDGELGRSIRTAFEKVNLIAFEKMWDNGFRQTTSIGKPIKSPEDLKGFKIRVPPAPLWTSLFKSLGAAPTSIPWGETYSALQTHVADGLENPLAGIYFAKMYEVQKYLSRTNHMWDGFWILANRDNFEMLPEDLRDIVVTEINRSALVQRADVEKLNSELQAELASKGLEFIDVDVSKFRATLQASSFYSDWKGRFGEEAWALLESTSGKLI